MQNANVPDEVVDVSNIFLVHFGSKDDKRSSRPITFADPTVGEENVLLFENNFGFVWTAARFLATDGLRTVCVDGEFEPKDGLAHIGFVKDVHSIVARSFRSFLPSRCRRGRQCERAS